jgi:hypothetical protein
MPRKRHGPCILPLKAENWSLAQLQLQTPHLCTIAWTSTIAAGIMSNQPQQTYIPSKVVETDYPVGSSRNCDEWRHVLTWASSSTMTRTKHAFCEREITMDD